MKRKKSQRGLLLGGVLLLALFGLTACGGGSSSVAEDGAPDDVVVTDENQIVFTESGIKTAESEGISVDGNVVTIGAAGTYNVSGTSDNASIQVAENLHDVTIVLGDLVLSSSETAPILIGSESAVTLQVDGKVTLTDAEPVSAEADGEDASADIEGATIKVKSSGSLAIDGSGAMVLNASECQDGIKGDDGASISIMGVKMAVDAADNAITSNGNLLFLGGTYTLHAGDVAIQSAPGDSGTKGYVIMRAGKFTIDAGNGAIQSNGMLTLGTAGNSNGPKLTITDCQTGLEGSTVALYSGSGTIYADGAGINATYESQTNSTATINIGGGDWTIDAGGEALSAKGRVRVTGGETVVYSAEGSDEDENGDTTPAVTVRGGTFVTIDSIGSVPEGTNLIFQTDILRGIGIEVHNSAEEVIFSTSSSKAGDILIMSGDALMPGESYSLYINGELIATEAATVNGTASNQPVSDEDAE